LINRLNYRRTHHDTIQVLDYDKVGAIATPVEMTVLNDLGRFHLVTDEIDRLPQTGIRCVPLKQQLQDKLIIDKCGEDLR